MRQSKSNDFSNLRGKFYKKILFCFSFVLSQPFMIKSCFKDKVNNLVMLTKDDTYCWFSVSRHSKQIKIKIKTVQWIKSRIWEKKEGKYAKALAKIQATAIFLMHQWKNFSVPKSIEIFTETPCWCPSIQHGGRKPTETPVTEFCYKSVNLSLEGLINIKAILFLLQELLRQPNSPK